jgi:hypothetical protein
LFIAYKSKKYRAKKVTDDLHYQVTISEMKREGNYSVDVYLGENFISKLYIKTHSKIATKNSDFDNLE